MNIQIYIIFFVVLFLIVPPVLYFLVPGSRSFFKSIQCSMNPTVCAIKKTTSQTQKTDYN